MPTITFLPDNVTAECQEGESVLEVGRREEIAIETSCVGQATCGLCRVKVIAGEENLNAFQPVEEKHLGNVYYLTRIRLSCQARIQGGDVTVELAPKRRRRRRA